ncbi:MAG: hypothetical protein EOP86_20270 [Verrucomicrobiaceae bacterium]|nr:MAG: hypothetical protein EOP86_20270 [Verrucomicrobiaceae bacterium]
MSTAGTAESDRILRILLARTEPEDRERLRVAWERHAQGDPDSLPSLYALADRFSLMAHAALLQRQERLLEAFHARVGGAAPMPFAPLRKPGKTGAWVFGALCGLLAGITGTLSVRSEPAPPDGDGAEAMMRRLKAAGGELVHYVSRREGGVFQVLELRTSGAPPEAYITPERHGVLVFGGSSPRKR